MEKYTKFLDKLIDLCEEGAKLNDFKWDDQAVAVVRTLFDAYVGPIKFGSLEHLAMETDTKGLPPWLVQIILQLLSKFLIK